MFTRLKTKKSQSGVTMIEYALIAALVAIAAIAMLSGLGTAIADKFQVISGAVTNGHL